MHPWRCGLSLWENLLVNVVGLCALTLPRLHYWCLRNVLLKLFPFLPFFLISYPMLEMSVRPVIDSSIIPMWDSCLKTSSLVLRLSYLFTYYSYFFIFLPFVHCHRILILLEVYCCLLKSVSTTNINLYLMEIKDVIESKVWGLKVCCCSWFCSKPLSIWFDSSLTYFQLWAYRSENVNLHRRDNQIQFCNWYPSI